MCSYSLLDFLLLHIEWTPYVSFSDACVDTPCLNGGTCVDGGGSTQCLCLPSYGGDMCQTGTTAKHLKLFQYWSTMSRKNKKYFDEINVFMHLTRYFHPSFRFGVVWTWMGEVHGILLSSLWQAARLGGSRAALSYVWRAPSVHHDPRGAGLHQWYSKSKSDGWAVRESG